MYVKFVIRRYTKGIPFLLKGIHPIAKTLSQQNEKEEKAKQELIRLIQPHSHSGFICSRYISPLEFSALLSYSFKQQQIPTGKYDVQVQMLQMNSLGASAYLIPIWLFFIFLRQRYCNQVYVKRKGLDFRAQPASIKLC